MIKNTKLASALSSAVFLSSSFSMANDAAAQITDQRPTIDHSAHHQSVDPK